MIDNFFNFNNMSCYCDGGKNLMMSEFKFSKFSIIGNGKTKTSFHLGKCCRISISKYHGENKSSCMYFSLCYEHLPAPHVRDFEQFELAIFSICNRNFCKQMLLIYLLAISLFNSLFDHPAPCN